jgi:putative membrane protein
VSPDASWSLSPGPIVLLSAATIAYVVRWWRVRESPWRLVLFLLGMLCVAAALLSPIDRLGEQLFTMHMVQHLLLLDFAPILIILGLTRKLLRPVTRRLLAVEQRAGWFATPTFAITLYVGTMWVWHWPALYDGALENQVVHVAEHFAFALAGGLYWWYIFSPIRSRHRLIGLGPAGYMLSTKVLVGLLGVFLTFASDSFYAFYEEQPRFWGMSPSEDQAVGGAIMALEQMIVMGAAFGWLFVRMLTESEKEEARAERFGPRVAAPAVPRVEVALPAGGERLPLGGAACREQLERQGAALREGLDVKLVGDGREVDAVATWDSEWGGWFAEPRERA